MRRVVVSLVVTPCEGRWAEPSLPAEVRHAFAAAATSHSHHTRSVCESVETFFFITNSPPIDHQSRVAVPENCQAGPHEHISNQTYPTSFTGEVAPSNAPPFHQGLTIKNCHNIKNVTLGCTICSVRGEGGGLGKNKQVSAKGTVGYGRVICTLCYFRKSVWQPASSAAPLIPRPHGAHRKP